MERMNTEQIYLNLTEVANAIQVAAYIRYKRLSNQTYFSMPLVVSNFLLGLISAQLDDKFSLLRQKYETARHVYNNCREYDIKDLHWRKLREIGMSGVLYQFKVFQILQDVYLVHSEVAKSGRDNIEYYHEFIKMVIRIFLQKKRHFLKVRFIDRMTRKLYRRRRTYFKDNTASARERREI